MLAKAGTGLWIGPKALGRSAVVWQSLAPLVQLSALTLASLQYQRNKTNRVSSAYDHLSASRPCGVSLDFLSTQPHSLALVRPSLLVFHPL